MPTQKQLAELRANRNRAGIAPAPPPEPVPDPIPAMPAEQPSQPRTTTSTTTTTTSTSAFPRRVTQTMTVAQFRKLESLARDLNREHEDNGKKQVYSIIGLVRAAVDICLTDDRLKKRLITAAGRPEHSGRTW